jgi:hypothetical protein
MVELVCNSSALKIESGRRYRGREGEEGGKEGVSHLNSYEWL